MDLRALTESLEELLSSSSDACGTCRRDRLAAFRGCTSFSSSSETIAFLHSRNFDIAFVAWRSERIEEGLEHCRESAPDGTAEVDLINIPSSD